MSKLIIIAVFEFPYVNMGTVQIYSVEPNGEILTDAPQSLVDNFDALSYGSTNVSDNMGTPTVVNTFVLLGLMATLLTMPFMQIPFEWTTRTNRWLRSTLLWNVPIRLLLEGCMENMYAFWL